MEADSAYSVIPHGEVQCIWMDAGVVRYKLCDRQLDCTGCPFDMEVRRSRDAEAPAIDAPAPAPNVPPEGSEHSHATFADLVTERMDTLATATAPADTLVHRQHFWLRQVDGDVFRMGITHVAAGILRPVLSIVRSNIPSQVRLHEPCCWLVVTKGTITVPSPVDATMLNYNPALIDRPSLLDTDPYGAGWMMELSVKPNAHGLKDFVSSDEHGPIARRQVAALQRAFTQVFRHRPAGVGSTMFDGGARLTDVESVLGPQAYFEVVSQIFRLPLEP